MTDRAPRSENDSEDDSTHRTLVQGLFVRHTPALRGFILALVRDFTVVDDVLQETFVHVTAKAAEFELGTNFQAWANAIARFKILEARRTARRQAHALSAEVIESLCACAPDEPAADPRLDLLRQCLEDLAPKAKQAIELRYAQAHKPAEIARRLGWTAESVYVALSRARGVLRDCLSRKLANEAGSS